MTCKWNYVPLDELTDVDSPITYGVVKPGISGDVRFIRGGDVADGRVLDDQLRTITSLVSEQYKRTLLRGGELLISLVGQPGQVAVVPSALKGANIARQVGLIRLGAQVDAQFISYFLRSPDGQASLGTHTGGSVQQVINLGDLRTVSVPLPPLQEQRRIVGILDEAFAGIATAKAHAEKNLQNARAMFQSQLNTVFTQREDGWVEKRLEEVADADCTLSYGIVQPGDEYINGLPIVRPTDLTAKMIRLGGLKRIDPKLASGYKRTALSGGELLLCVRGSTGMVSIASAELVGGNVTRGIVPIRFDQSLLIPDFGFYLMSSGEVQSQIRAKTYGAALMQINIRDVRGIRLWFPPLKNQKTIAATLDGLTQETQCLAAIYERKLAALESLKKSLLHQAFTGQLTARTLVQGSSLVPFPATVSGISTTDLHAGILALAFQAHKNAGRSEYFTHVKAEKLAHLVEALVGIDLGREPVKDAAGPNDFPHLLKVEYRARKAKFFDFQRTTNGPYQVQPLSGFENLVDKVSTALGKQLKRVEDLLNWMVPMNVQQAEIVATVFAAWNNLLLDGNRPTDEEIVFEARENWHLKKLKIPREKFFDAVQLLKEQNKTPEGKGKRVANKGK